MDKEFIEEEPQSDESEETSVEEEESEESPSEEEETQPEEDPKEEEEDYHVPKEDKPKRTEKEKAEFTLKSVAKRYKDLGGNPADLVTETTGETPSDTTQFVTKRDFAQTEARKVARSETELSAIMAWVDKGMSVEDAHLLANKGRIKSTFSEMDRANVKANEATGAGQKKPAPRAPKPSQTQLMQWRRAGMTYDPAKGTAAGKFTEEFWDGSQWASRKIK